MGRRFLLSTYLADMASLAIAIGVGSMVAFGTPFLWSAEVPGGGSPWPFVALMVLGATVSSYLSWLTWAQTVPRPSYGRALAIVGFTVAFTAVALVITRAYWSRPMFLAAAGTWLALAVAHRAIRRGKPWSEPIVLVTKEKGLAEDLADAPHADVVRVLDPGEEPPENSLPDHVSLVVDLRAVLSEDMAQWVTSWSIAGVPIRALSPVYEEHTGRIPMVHLAEGWELAQPVQRSGYAPVKRFIDVVLVLVTAPLWILVALVIAIAVKFDSPGPAIYHQERVGRRGSRFTLHKFRTMDKDAEIDGPKFASIDDPRLTRTGRVLRKTRMDEVPQLWNVLKGDLSLVGPRPERPIFVDEFSRTIPYYADRLLIRPGVTGWAQVNYGYADDEAETIEKLTYDLYYVKHSSLWLDLQILGKSMWTVLTGFGAR
jgi:exopolysaccharide biosynthesis polyprenyl glycosylphosphotransferase